MKRYLRKLLLLALDVLGINALCRTLNRNKVIILLYHGICDDTFDLLKGYDERHIPRSLFRKHLEYLKRRGYVFVSMTGWLDAMEKKSRLKKSVVLTFDDGFRNVVGNAYPIMKEYGARGCLYLVSDLVGTDELLWTDYVETVIRNQKTADFKFIFKGEVINYILSDSKSVGYAMKDIKARLRTLPDKERREHLEQFGNYKLIDIPREFIMADWEQIKTMDPDILEVGCHTRRHPNCTNLVTGEELEDELNNSKLDIEKNTVSKVIHFCYPAGAYNDRVISSLRSYGYKTAVTVEKGFNDECSNLFKLKRIAVDENILFFKAGVSGSYHMLRRIKAMIGL